MDVEYDPEGVADEEEDDDDEEDDGLARLLRLLRRRGRRPRAVGHAAAAADHLIDPAGREREKKSREILSVATKFSSVEDFKKVANTSKCTYIDSFFYI